MFFVVRNHPQITVIISRRKIAPKKKPQIQNPHHHKLQTKNNISFTDLKKRKQDYFSPSQKKTWNFFYNISINEFLLLEPEARVYLYYLCLWRHKNVDIAQSEPEEKLITTVFVPLPEN